MPSLNAPQLQQLGLPPALDKYAREVAYTVNKALVVGDSLRVLTPYTQQSPLVVPSGWTALSLNAGFSNFGTFVAQYRKDAAGTVWLQGLVTAAAAGNLATLPSGFRPAQQKDFATAFSVGGAETYGRLKVGTDGVVNLSGANPTTWGSIDCSFPCSDFAPGVPSCFPFDVAWPLSAAPTLVLAQVQDATSAASPANLALASLDWQFVTLGGRSFVRVRNIPGLLPSRSYAVTLVGF